MIPIDEIEPDVESKTGRPPSLLEALIPVIVLMALLALSLALFGVETTDGPVQVALLLTTMVAAGIALKNDHRWDEINAAMFDGITTALGAVFILLAVGALIGTWAMSGTIPGMVYYGSKLLHPSYFYAGCFLVSGIVALSLGSSWTTAGTAGVGLIGVSSLLGMNEAITAGAVISGAYLGDHFSPLSDSIILASSVADVDLYTHLRASVWTGVPAALVSLVAFGLFGLGADAGQSNDAVRAGRDVLDAVFNITPLVLLPLPVVIGLALKRIPPFPTILAGAFAGGVTAVLLQGDLVREFAADPSLSGPGQLVKGVWAAMANGYVADTGVPRLDQLVSVGGMDSMLTTIWLIICAMGFGAVMEFAGMLERINQSIMRLAQSTARLIATTVATGIGLNMIAGDDYLAIVLPGRMYKAEFAKRGLAPWNLSRAIKDAGATTSPLVPWNTAGAFMAGTLGVATLTYLPYCFFNVAIPVISVVLGVTGFKIDRLDDREVWPPEQAALQGGAG